MNTKKPTTLDFVPPRYKMLAKEDPFGVVTFQIAGCDVVIRPPVQNGEDPIGDFVRPNEARVSFHFQTKHESDTGLDIPLKKPMLTLQPQIESHDLWHEPYDGKGMGTTMIDHEARHVDDFLTVVERVKQRDRENLSNLLDTCSKMKTDLSWDPKNANDDYPLSSKEHSWLQTCKGLLKR